MTPKHDFISPNLQILIIDDDPEDVEFARLVLNELGVKVLVCDHVVAAQRVLRQKRVGLILLDLHLPGLNGLDLLTDLSAHRSTTPIIFLTGETDPEVMVRCITLGADDYITKPYRRDNLVARVLAVLRRHRVHLSTAIAPQVMAHDEPLEFGVARIYPQQMVLGFPNNRRVKLTPTEMGVICYFARNPRRVLPKTEIYSAIWQRDPAEAQSRAVDQYVSRIRTYFERAGYEIPELQTVFAVGYKYVSS